MDPQNPNRKLSRRRFLKMAGLSTVGVPTLAVLESITPYQRMAQAQAQAAFPDIQFDIGRFIAPVQTVNGIQVQFGPIFTLFSTARLTRRPNRTDQQNLAAALNRIEATYPFSPSGIFVFTSYGRSYFNNNIPANVITANVPRLRANTNRFVLEEAVPSPTDVHPNNPSIVKRRFNVPVRIEANDMLFTFRSDSLNIINDVRNWLGGSGRLRGQAVALPAGVDALITFNTDRLMFTQRGLPRQIANQNNLQFRQRVNPDSPMWMGFADQQVDASGPAAITTFVGNASSRLTTATAGSYFDNGSVQHLSHVIMDLNAFYAIEGEDGFLGEDETFLERVQYMFHSPPPSRGNADQFTNGGGPAFLQNQNLGTGQAAKSAQGIGTDVDDETGLTQHRIGHVSALQRSSRAANGTPVHIRMDGPGFDSFDVPGGSQQAKLQFTVFVPTADFFTTMRRNTAALDLAQQFDVEESDNGLERFLTTTRRQNFLCPPRRHRAFPLVEL